MRPHMPNMEGLLNQISSEITKAWNETLWISKTDLKQEYGQLKLSEKTSKHCKVAMTGAKKKDILDSTNDSTVYRINRRYSKKK